MFVNLNARSHYTLLGSTLSVPDLVEFANSSGSQYVALIDKNTMYGAYELYKLAVANDLKPIIGLTIESQNTELSLIAKNYEGYQRLMAISSAVMTKTPFELTDDENLLKVASENKWGFKRGFYSSSDLAWQTVLYKDENDHRTYLALRAIAEGRMVEERAFQQPGINFLLTVLQAKERFSAKQIGNLDKLVGEIDLLITPVANNILKYALNTKQKKDAALRAMCMKGLHHALGENLPAAYEKRLDYELAVIAQKGFEDYFLIVWDYVRWSKEHGILVGPGRGSAPGSLVSYALNITTVDPIKANLLFERFLSSERISMPDIDIDFMDIRRDEVIKYIFQKYGKERVAHIAVFQRMKAKMAIRDVGRILGTPASDIDAITKSIGHEVEENMASAIEASSVLQAQVIKHELLFAIASRLVGMPRQAGMHAAGIVLSEKPLLEIVPVQTGPADIAMTQYSMEHLEELGLLKMDILGLRNLTIIDQVIKSIALRKNVAVELEKIPFEEKRSMALLNEAHTTGIFQLESPGMRKLMLQLGVDTFEDIVAATSLFRPGPQENIPSYVARKKGKEKVEGIPKGCEDILGFTYGIIVYQEQVMQVAQRVAGFSLGRADILRRAMGKKDMAKMAGLHQEFIAGAVGKGYDQSEAERIFNYVLRFAAYGFNRSHAYVYSVISYWMAFLKANFTLEFMSVLMTQFQDDPRKVQAYANETEQLGHQLLPPSVNNSTDEFAIEDNGLRFPLPLIKGLGAASCQSILEERTAHGPFKDHVEAYCRLRCAGVSQANIGSMALVGCFDELNVTRKTFFKGIEKLEKYYALVAGNGRPNFKVQKYPALTETEEFSEAELATYELQLMGYTFVKKVGGVDSQGYQSIASLESEPETMTFTVAGRVLSLREIRDKKGRVMAFLDLADDTGKVSVTLFYAQYAEHAETIKKNRDRLIAVIKRDKGGRYLLGQVLSA